MKPSGEIEPTGVFALLAGAKCAHVISASPASSAGPPRAAEALTVFTSLDEARSAVETAASSAQRMISIYTPDLEPDLYDQSAFLEIIKRFVLSRSFSKVRVLLADPGRVVRDSNRFAAMGRRLSSYIDIRHIGEQPAPRAPQTTRGETGAAQPPVAPAHRSAGAYLIADDRAVVYRLRADTWDGIADFNNPSVARLYLTEFDALWAASSPEDALRAARARA
ncbi:MAG: hypothetical protein ACREUT_21750 [Steroidobacteraceae bacterium]